MYSSSWSRFSPERRAQSIENVINTYAKTGGNAPKQSKEDGSLISQLDEIQEQAKKSKRMNGKNDMATVLNADIVILRDITKKAVINAIGLERAFNSVIIKNVDLIRNHLDEDNGKKAYQAWIRENAAKLMPSHFEHIIEQGAIREKKKAIVSAVRNLLNKWD